MTSPYLLRGRGVGPDAELPPQACRSKQEYRAERQDGIDFVCLPRLLEEFYSPLDLSLFLSSARSGFLQNSALGARSLTPETKPKVLIPSPVKSHPRHREI